MDKCDRIEINKGARTWVMMNGVTRGFVFTATRQNEFTWVRRNTALTEKLSMKVKLMFAWYDMWIGAFWDRKQKTLYLFPLPMIGMKIQITPRG
jgi:hypothetical protein